MTEEKSRIWKILERVMDPEVPALSVVDLGIIREIRTRDSGRMEVLPEIELSITPTYSGCPAMEVIRQDIRSSLLQSGYPEVRIDTVLSPAWTTDWMSEKGKEKLKAFGIAPPAPRQQVCDRMLFHEEESIQCPQCNSYHTSLISRFGSTPCKALYRCNDCQEPFDYFKCH
jgi:ring-1,2-phenylacetyl-CoA epoxidase subunit PaaD